MGYTITEKILLAHTNKKDISPGEFINARIDFCFGNDITAPLAIDEFERAGAKRVFNAAKIALIPDHFTPNKDMRSAESCKKLKNFAVKYKIKHHYEIGRMGIEHALLPELGLITPGALVIGADSHTTTHGALGAFASGVGSTDLAAAFISGRCWLRVPETIKFIYRGKPGNWVGGKDIILHTIGSLGVDGATYKAMEFSGEAIKKLSMDDRFAICNMAIEAGAGNGIIEPDEITFDYLHATRYTLHATRKKAWSVKLRAWSKLKSDFDAHYADIKEYNVSNLEPLVALPHSPGKVKPVSRVKNRTLDQVVIGSCTNGRISDLRIAARVLKGRKISSRLRLIVIPATQAVYLEALKEGLIEVFIKAGGVVSTPTCGPCLGGHMGVLAKGERALATTNRNFKGRMGHPDSEVYLSNPAVAAASAVKGKICHPEEVV